MNTDIFKKKTLILDGGLGTELQKRGVELGKVPEAANITHPEVVQQIHRDYIKAGADAVMTCSFGVNRYKLEGTDYTVRGIVEAAVSNARKAAEGTGALVALDIGPIGRLVEPNGNLSFEEAYDIFKEQIVAGKDADYIAIETMTDLYEMRIALLAAKENSSLPVSCTMSFQEDMRTFTGTSIPSMALTLEGMGADAIGFNCSLGPAEFKPLIEELSKWTNLPIVAKANAGLPDPATGEYMIGPKDYVQEAREFMSYGVSMVGGCCGTDPEYVKLLAEEFKGAESKARNVDPGSALCTPEHAITIDGPAVVGERINPTGKKALKEALAAEDYEYILELALKQVEEGAEILDINLGMPGIDEPKAMENVVKTLQGSVTVPLQFDSNKPEVLEAGLRHYCGKGIINSVSGEEKSLESILPIAAKYGAAIIGLTLDEDGIPKTKEKRLEIAEKIIKRAEDFGISRSDIYIDCLTLTVSAEQDNAMNTLEALREVKEKFGVKTVLGVSNVSFGLPARGIINANFLQMALTYGLDLAIINPGAFGMMEAIHVNRLITGKDRDARFFVEHYKDREEQPSVNKASQKVDSAASSQGDSESLAYLIRNGFVQQSQDRIKRELKTREPLDIVDNDLIPVLDSAGLDFEKGKIFIPQLILCANTAQACFDLIKEKLQSAGEKVEYRGKILVATVKGDVHDIGKNIVKVILENYGYEIIDLGKDVEPSEIVKTAESEDIRLVGLSALMTTTLPSMEETVKLLKQKNEGIKVMAGGAVLTEDFALGMGADFYVKDAQASCDAAASVFGK